MAAHASKNRNSSELNPNILIGIFDINQNITYRYLLSIADYFFKFKFQQ